MCVKLKLSEKKNFFFPFFVVPCPFDIEIIGKSNFLRLAPKCTGESGPRKLPALTMSIMTVGRPLVDPNWSRYRKNGSLRDLPKDPRRANRKTSQALWSNYRTIPIRTSTQRRGLDDGDVLRCYKVTLIN